MRVRRRRPMIDAHRPIRSYALRQKRLSPAQARAWARLWPYYGLCDKTPLRVARAFEADVPLALEIGFGNGEHLLRQAAARLQTGFIGIEVWSPGIGSLLHRLAASELRNVRIVRADAREYLRKCMPAQCLDAAWILFPDPWPKTRHHKRRLVDGAFLELLAGKMKPGAPVCLATDWEHYARAMLDAANACPQFQVASLASGRTVQTRFERRGVRAGRAIFDLELRRRATTMVPVRGFEPPTY